MFRIYDGREKLYQWDLNRKLIVDDSSIKEVHFANCLCTSAQVCETYQEGELTVVNVPNNLLQEYMEVKVYGYDGEATKHGAVFEVERRTKPSDYVYTETEVKRFEDLEERITALEEKEVNLDGYATVEYVDEQRDNMYNELYHEVGYLQNEIDTRTPNYDNLTTYYDGDFDYGTANIELLAFVNGELAIYAKPAVTFYLVDSNLQVCRCYCSKDMCFSEWLNDGSYDTWGHSYDYIYDENGDIVDSTEYLVDANGSVYSSCDIWSMPPNGAVYINDAIYAKLNIGGGSGGEEDNRNDIMFILQADTDDGECYVYTAKEGMTWEEWANSEYSEGWQYGYYDYPAYDCLYDEGCFAYVDVNGYDVIPAGEIIKVNVGSSMPVGNTKAIR